jgi:hypothetical protein
MNETLKSEDFLINGKFVKYITSSYNRWKNE